MAEEVPQVIWPSDQLLLNKFVDPSIPSMRKVDDGEKKKKKKKEKNGIFSGRYVIASSLPPERRRWKLAIRYKDVDLDLSHCIRLI